MSAAIFDMDGLLIDSEPIWREAEIGIFSSLGIPMTEDMCRQTMGWRCNEVIAYWHQQFRWSGPGVDEVEQQLLTEVDRLIQVRGEALPGVETTLKNLAETGIPIALASSSPSFLINSVVEKLNIKDYFQVIRSAEGETYGKPHPGVFLSTAEDLKADPTQCLVFEDSFHGIIAALAARMKVIGVPAEEDRSQPRFNAATHLLYSLEDFKLSDLDRWFNFSSGITH